MKNKIVEVNTVEEFDRLTEREQMIAWITYYRLYLYNRGLHCGPKAIQEKMREEIGTPVPSISTIARALRSQYLTHGRTGYYEADYPEETEKEEEN
jgi:hypothetical protein|tara:strand:- start:73 stop:360 length:288 start_codon:yes stop_codon:yes gene_type:complete